jgi:hypothetical protein
LLSHDFLQNDENQKIAFSAGLFYRFKDAIVPVIKLDYNKIGIGFNYDVNISKLKTASQMRGSYEVTISYKGFTSNQNSSANMVRCPAFY